MLDGERATTTVNIEEVVLPLDARYNESPRLFDALSDEERAAVETAYIEHQPYWQHNIDQGQTTGSMVREAHAERLLISRHILAPMAMNWAQDIARQLRHAPQETKAIFFMRDGNLAYTFVRFLVEHGYEPAMSVDNLVPLYLSRNTQDGDERVTRYIEQSLTTSGESHATPILASDCIAVDTGNNGSIVTLLKQYLPQSTRIHANYFMLSISHGIPGAMSTKAYLPVDAFDLVMVESAFDPREFDGLYPYPQKVGDYSEDGAPVLVPSTNDYRTSIMKASEAGIRLYLQDVIEGRARLADASLDSADIIERAGTVRSALGMFALQSLQRSLG